MKMLRICLNQERQTFPAVTIFITWLVFKDLIKKRKRERKEKKKLIVLTTGHCQLGNLRGWVNHTNI